jgi:hypothetical protein
MGLQIREGGAEFREVSSLQDAEHVQAVLLRPSGGRAFALRQLVQLRDQQRREPRDGDLDFPCIGRVERGQDDDPDDALPLLQSASVAGRSAVRQRKARRVQRLGGKEFALPPLCAASEGYSLHAGVLIGARDRKGLRRLAGYIARPPLAVDRVEALPGDRVRLPLKRPWSDGTTALELSAEELAERLIALVPPPRANQVLYGGVLASRHRWHRAVRPRPPKRRVAPAGVGVRLTKSGTAISRWTPWSVLLWRVFGVNGLACPTCGKVMVLRAEVRPPATLSVLASLERSARGPPSRAQSAGTA